MTFVHSATALVVCLVVAVAGLVWRNGEEVVRNPPRPILWDLDQFPYPDRTSLPIEYIESLRGEDITKW